MNPLSTSNGDSEKSPWLLRSKTRFFLTLFLVLAVPTVVLVVLVGSYVRKDLRRQAIEHNSLTARLVAQSLDEEFAGLQRFVENFSRRSKLIEWVQLRDKRLIRGKLDEMLFLNSKLTRGFVTDTNGILLADWPARDDLVGKNFSERDWYKGATNSSRAYVSEIYSRLNMDKADAVTICIRIQNTNSEAIGYLGAQFTVDRLSAWLQAVKPSKQGLVHLFDQRGTPALPKNVARPETHRLPVINQTFTDNEGWTQMRDPLTGEDSLITYVRVPSINWTVVARQPLSQLFAPVEVLLHTILIFFLVCLAGTGVIGYVLFDTLTKYNERRRASERNLANKAAALKRSNDELEGMCYSIAHDLRAPLRAMRGFTSALIEDYNPVLDSVGKNYTKRIDESAGRMDELIQDLLDYGKLGHVELPIHSVSVADCLQQALQTLTEDIRRTGACIDVQKPLHGVMANETILQQVLTNLISNATKFVALGVAPQIKVITELRGDRVRISVRDNGIGIDPMHHKRIFGVFERLHSYEAYPGTGIGLAIVRKGVERMNGTMGLDSSVGKGSCFWFELPKA